MNTIDALRYIKTQVSEISQIVLLFDGQQIGFKFNDGRPGYFKIVGNIPVEMELEQAKLIIEELKSYLAQGGMAKYE